VAPLQDAPELLAPPGVDRPSLRRSYEEYLGEVRQRVGAAMLGAARGGGARISLPGMKGALSYGGDPSDAVGPSKWDFAAPHGRGGRGSGSGGAGGAGGLGR